MRSAKKAGKVMWENSGDMSQMPKARKLITLGLIHSQVHRGCLMKSTAGLPPNLAFLNSPDMVHDNKVKKRLIILTSIYNVKLSQFSSSDIYMPSQLFNEI